MITIRDINMGVIAIYQDWDCVVIPQVGDDIVIPTESGDAIHAKITARLLTIGWDDPATRKIATVDKMELTVKVRP